MSSYRFTILHERFNYTIWRTKYVLKVHYPICNSNFRIVFVFWLIISLTFLELDIFGLWLVTTVTVVTSEKWRTLSVKYLPCSDQDFFFSSYVFWSFLRQQILLDPPFSVLFPPYCLFHCYKPDIFCLSTNVQYFIIKLCGSIENLFIAGITNVCCETDSVIWFDIAEGWFA